MNLFHGIFLFRLFLLLLLCITIKEEFVQKIILTRTDNKKTNKKRTKRRKKIKERERRTNKEERERERGKNNKINFSLSISDSHLILKANI